MKQPAVHLILILLALVRAEREEFDDALLKDTEDATLLATRMRLETQKAYTKSDAHTLLATGLDAESNSSSRSGGITLPDCPRQVYSVNTAVKDIFSWCNADLVPLEERAPEKIQGLFWLKGLPLADVMACFSAGSWSQDSLTLKFQVYQNFVFRDTYSGLATVSLTYTTGLTYYIKFETAALENAVISSSGDGGLGDLPVWFYNSLTSFPLDEEPGTNGERWSRPSYFGVCPLCVKMNEYEAWKVMDGKGNVIQGNHEAMLAELAAEGTTTLVHFPATCSGGGSGQTVVTPGSASCSAGLFVTLDGQPQLAIAHVAEAAGVVATFTTARGCVVKYETSCLRGYVIVKPLVSCPQDKRILKLPRGSPEGAFKDYWEVCSDDAGVLTTPFTLLDQTWGTTVPASSPVAGCVRLLAAADWPELNALRGDLSQQGLGLAARRAAVGGCPLYRSDADRRERGSDFEGMGIWLNLYQRFQRSRAENWQQRTSRGNTLGNLFSLAYMAVGARRNRTTSFTTWALLNCGEPSPFVNGPQYFRHSQVLRSATDPKQLRTYSTSTVPQSETCFQRTALLFLNSGSNEHTQLRQLLDAAGFAAMDQTRLPAVVAKVPDKGMGASAPAEEVVAKPVLERVILAVWGMQPSEALVDTILPYAKTGKICIFGQDGGDLVSSMPSIMEQIVQIRQANAGFGMGGPMIKKAVGLLGSYPSVNALYTATAQEKGKEVAEVLATDVGDAVLFAGLLGTSHMAHRCVLYQWRDHRHVALYRKDKLAYLHELMRYDGAVTSFTTAMKAEEAMKLEGMDMSLPQETPVQMVLASANRDRNVFPNPEVFDPERAEIGEQLSWNGRLKDVMARNYAAAPRLCPGYHLSIQIAKQVCDHYTQYLSPYSSEVGTHITGTVQVLKPGDWQGHHAVVGYTDFRTNELCVLKPNEIPALYIGCFKASELKVIDPTPVFPRTWKDESAACPAMADTIVMVLAKGAFTVDDSDPVIQEIKETIVGKSNESEHLSSKWTDDFASAFYTSVLHFKLRKYVTRHSHLINIPVRTGQAETFSVGNVIAPNLDIDEFDPSSFMSSHLIQDMIPISDCVQNVLRNFAFEDKLDVPDENTWAVALGKNKRKKDWVLGFWDMYRAEDGSPVWPAPELDLAQLFLKGDTWDDRLEMSIAFDLIGTHRVESAKRPHGGETLPFVVKLNAFSKLAVRKDFGVYQGDMYFTSTGMPALIELADGSVVQAGDKDWQYWKFVWRSSLITTITLVDHLHDAHLRAGNLLARVSRRTLSPDHPMRRLLSVFTFGTIEVNLDAMHALVAPDHSLHRCTPFKDFELISRIVPPMLPDLLEQHRVLYDNQAFASLPTRLQEAPYYQDGRLLYGAILRMVQAFVAVYRDDFCDSSNSIKQGSEMEKFRDVLAEFNIDSNYQGTTKRDSDCGYLTERLAAGLWTVTGWHRHVGTVADFYVDPDLAAPSWKDGEAFPRPKQTLITSIIAAITGTQQPKLIEDFTHVFRGMPKEQEAVAVLTNFNKELQSVSSQVAQNNGPRQLVKNYHADPKIVECSIAV